MSKSVICPVCGKFAPAKKVRVYDELSNENKLLKASNKLLEDKLKAVGKTINKLDSEVLALRAENKRLANRSIWDIIMRR